MHRGTHAVISALVVLACTGCPSGDGALPGACQIDPGAIHAEDGAVVAEITVTCDPRPVRHEIKGWLAHRRDSDQKYAQLSASGWVTTIPDAEGFRVRVESRPCKDGQWKAAWRARGVGPGPLRARFDYRDEDTWPTTVTKQDCWGWSR